MIGETRGAKLLEGVRGGRPAGVTALARLLVEVSDLNRHTPRNPAQPFPAALLAGARSPS
jgi:hypothetical protein